MNKRVTVYDIAGELNISTSSVSRSLNNSSLVSDDVKRLVLQTAERMGYHKRLIRRQEDRSILSIALFLPFTGESYRHLFYDVGELLAGIEAGLSGVRANIVTALNGTSRIFDQKKLGDIDAAVFAFSRPKRRLEELISARHMPSLLINRSDPDHNYVIPDNEGGMDLIVERLVQAGRAKKLHYIGFSRAEEISQIRYQGLIDACKKRGLSTPNLTIVDTIDQIDSDFVLNAISQGTRALLAFNDLVAVRILAAALEANINIPEDCALTGFDNSPVLRLATRRIDTVSLSTWKLGQESGLWLKKSIIDRERTDLAKRIPLSYVKGETVFSKNDL